MVHRFECPLCRKPVTAAANLAGTRVKCPHCSDEFVTPSFAETPPALPPRPTSGVPGALMRFTFTCQRCGSALEGHSGLSGQLGRCPTCGALFVIPEVDRRTGLPTGPAVVADDGELPTPMHAYAAAGAKAPAIRRRPDGAQVIVCPRCDFEASVDANICGRCGLPFTIEGASAIAAGAATSSNSMATASLVLGILALPTSCMPVLGALAIIFGVIALMRISGSTQSQAGRGHAIAGTICGAISLALGAMFLLRLL